MKKGSKKKAAKKKAEKKSTIKLKVKKTIAPKPVVKAEPAPASSSPDHSTNYNVTQAVAKLRTLKTPEEVKAFTKGEQRITITRIVPSALSRLGN